MKLSTTIRQGMLKVSYTHKGKQSIFSTGYKVHPSYLKSDGRLRKSHPQHQEINQAIEGLYARVSRALEYIQSQGKEPTTQAIRNRLSASEYADTTVVMLYAEYIKRFTRKETISNNYYGNKWLKRYCPHALASSCTNQQWIDDYYSYLQGHMSMRSANSRVKLVASMLRYYMRRGLPGEDFKVPNLNENKPVDALLPYEISYLKQVSLKSSSRQRTVDIFLLGYYTGCRYGDLSRLNSDNVEDNVLLYKQRKTNTWVKVPLHQHARKLLYKLEGQFIHRAWFNQHIKLIFQELGMNRMIRGQPLYKLISSHWMRRTHTTIALREGINVHEVMENTGRSSYSSMKRYIDMKDIKIRENHINRL